jgi:hypothetical protein
MGHAFSWGGEAGGGFAWVEKHPVGRAENTKRSKKSQALLMTRVGWLVPHFLWVGSWVARSWLLGMTDLLGVQGTSFENTKGLKKVVKGQDEVTPSRIGKVVGRQVRTGLPRFGGITSYGPRDSRSHSARPVSRATTADARGCWSSSLVLRFHRSSQCPGR